MDEQYADDLFDLLEELLQYDDLDSQIAAAEVLAKLRELDPTWEEDTDANDL